MNSDSTTISTLLPTDIWKALLPNAVTVVLEPDEVGQRLEAVPLVQAVLHRLEDGQDDEDGVQHQRREQEQRRS